MFHTKVSVVSPPAAMAAKYNSPPNWNTAAGSLGAANGGVAYTFNLSASDPQNQVLTYTLQSGSLPTGLSLSSSGVISGTPTNIPGTSNFIVRVSDGEFYTDRTFSLDITNQTPIWETAGGALTAGTQGVAYTVTFVATDPNNDIVTYSVIGSLPDGLTLNSSTGELSGTPTTVNSYSFTIRATDALSAYVDRAFSVVISEQPDQYWNNVSLLLHFNTTGFVDSSKNGITPYNSTGGVYDSSVAKFGSGSINFDGTQNILRYTNQTALQFDGTSDFTWEYWFYPRSTSYSTIFCGASSSNLNEIDVPWGWYNNGNFAIGWRRASDDTFETSVATGISCPINNWYHVAHVYTRTSGSRGVMTTYINGQLGATTTTSDIFSSNKWGAVDSIYLGGLPSNGIMNFKANGNLDELRFTKGVARYTANFTPSIYPFPNS